jgi:hypothetical protein
MHFIDDENKNVYNKHGLSIANPIKSALLFVSYFVYVWSDLSAILTSHLWFFFFFHFSFKLELRPSSPSS